MCVFFPYGHSDKYDLVMFVNTTDECEISLA